MARGFVQQNNNKIVKKTAATKGEYEQSVCAINPVVEFCYTCNIKATERHCRCWPDRKTQQAAGLPPFRH